MKQKRYFCRPVWALFLIVSQLLSACTFSACGSSDVKATTMHLSKTEGNVTVADNRGSDLEPQEQLGLYDGYQVATQAESYAWINLDHVKLTKMDAESRIGIQKDGSDLEILVQSGSLFFNVTEPLSEDETMNIRTSNMIVGIRGTCGWVEVPDQNHMQVSLLEGSVTCMVFDLTGRILASETISAGETARMIYHPDGESSIQKEELRLPDIPPYVLEEVEDAEIPTIQDTLERLNGEQPWNEEPETEEAPSGEQMEADRQRKAAFLEILNSLPPEEAMYARLGDLNGDGVEDLLTFGAYNFRLTPGQCFIGYIWNGSSVNRTPLDKTEFMHTFGTAGGFDFPGYAVYRERSTGILYIRYMIHMDGHISCSFENALDQIPLEYEYDYELPGSNAEKDRILTEIQTWTDERFELLDIIDTYALSSTVEDLKVRLSEEITAGEEDAAIQEQELSFGQDTLPAEVDSMPFVFASGAGGWATHLTLHADGSFEGEFYDSELGESGEGFRSTRYTCIFSGQFTNIRKVNDYTYSMIPDHMATQVPSGTEWIEGDTRYVASDPYGIQAGEPVLLYTPDAPVEELPQEFLDWRMMDRDVLSGPLSYYALFYPAGTGVFFPNSPQ